MKRGKTFNLLSYLFIAALFAVLLCSCGNAEREQIGGQSTEAETVGLDVCVTCHVTQTADWKTSKHANIDPAGDLNSAGTPSYADFSDATCAACHDQLGDGQRLTADWTGNVPRPVTGCESCHGGGSQHYGAGPIALLGSASANALGSAQFNTCTSCHGLLNSDGTGTVTATHDPVGASPMTTDDIITDTHFATPGIFPTPTAVNTADVTGYYMDYANERVCTNCHNPHKPPTQNREWVLSRHADKTEVGAWAHYNWSLPSRAACQRCHTTTGFVAFADATASDTIYSAPLTTNLSFKPEMLECNGCHTDNKGSLRNPGKFVPPDSPTTSFADYVFPEGRSIPDSTVIVGSVVCVNCHSGRETGMNIITNYTDTSVSGKTFSTFNSHYLTAGGILFNVSGYEYAGLTSTPGRDYSNSGIFMHDKIGTPNSPISGTGTNGPCIECHMQTDEPHLFTAVSRMSEATAVNAFTAPTNTITAITSQEVCALCHGETRKPALLNTMESDYSDSLRSLETALKLSSKLTTSICYNPSSSPYFYVYSSGVCSSSSYTTWPDRDTLGAAYNMNMLVRMPGAFVHNNSYTKRLIYDSLDYLDDGNLNYTVGSTLTTGPTYTYFDSYRAGTMTFILPNGVLTGDPAERP